ncbi:hypothetical protein ACIGW3_19800 [Streptomyces sp. NPDC053499]|uniref:hypothetical protein n=1 Tax=Streptomyces sp. NPDC053499 TaxID=3365707 RepID=UPI0037D93D5A
MPTTTEAVETIRTTDAADATDATDATDAAEVADLDLDALIAELDTRISTDELPEGRMHSEACSGLCTVVICNSVVVC